MDLNSNINFSRKIPLLSEVIYSISLNMVTLLVTRVSRTSLITHGELPYTKQGSWNLGGTQGKGDKGGF